MNENNMLSDSPGETNNSVGFKMVIIFVLILALLIPSAMVKSLIRERESRKHDVINEISSKWGEAQTITGPVISIPYKHHVIDKNGKRTETTKYMHFLPDRLDVKSEILPEIRYRGIYETVLYNTKTLLNGSFSYPEVSEMNVPIEDIVWTGAFISVGISDMRGIKDQITASFNKDVITMNPGIETNDVICSGISSKIRLHDQTKEYKFSMAINLNGSHILNFVPVGETTFVSMNSTWPDPSFGGAYVPNTYDVSKDGFKAEWKVLHLNRNYPQHWTGDRYNLNASSFGVKLFMPVDTYQKTDRIAKYALMFIVFTFLAFFFSEVMNKLRVHPIQYLLVGCAIVIFYSLLISISEHINFNLAYLISSLATVILITGYAKSILKSKRLSNMVGAVLTSLYIYMYILLQLEDYALLMGSMGLFVVLGIIMHLTRRIDWYSIKLETSK